MLYFGIWLLLCIVVGVGIGLLRGNIPLGVTLVPILCVPFAYVCCYEWLTVVLVVIFIVLAIINGKAIWNIWKKTKKRSRHPGKLISIPAVIVLFAVWFLFMVSNTVISALLVPEFMRKLDAFEEITEQSYSELVQTNDIKENHKAAVAATNEWIDTVKYEKPSIKTSDGYTLNAVTFFAEKESHNWVLLAHGYTGWKEEMYPFAYWYSTQGYNSVVPDCRCSGSSEGDFIGMGYTDSYDMLGWIDYILEIDPDAKIVLHGQSMGGATVLLMSGLDELPHSVVAVVSDCAYSDAFTMFQTTACNWFGIKNSPDFLLEFVCFTFRLRGGYDFHRASPIHAVVKSNIPILFIHGDSDKMVSPDMVYELYEAATCKKDILVVEGAGHAQSQDKDPEGYYGKVAEFLR